MNKKAKYLSALYKRVFDTEDGHEVLRDMMKKAGMMSVEKCERESDFQFWQGKKAMLMEIIYLIQLDEKPMEDLYLKKDNLE